MNCTSIHSAPQIHSSFRRLVIRLSSLGDVILASSFLQTERAAHGVDWVVAEEYAELLEGHPKIRNLWKYDRRTGLKAWIRLCEKLRNENYDEIIDLHSSLRTAIARVLFFFWTLRGPTPRWIRVSKSRIRFYGYILFKNSWPKSWRPQAWVERYSHLGGGKGSSRPDMTHLLRCSSKTENEHWRNEPTLCVMPSSRWSGKRWDTQKFFEVLRQQKRLPIILGSNEDSASHRLVELLKKAGSRYVAGVGAWNLVETAHVLAQSDGYLGNDTGLAILAEAVGTPAIVVFGPTTPESGFGPWRPESRPVEAALACRPCGKDGRFCYRLSRRHLCLSGLASDSVVSILNQDPAWKLESLERRKPEWNR